MKKKIIIGLVVLTVGAVLFVGRFYYRNLQGVWPAVLPATSDLVDVLPPVVSGNPLPSPSIPLHLPPGFSIELLSGDVSGARAMVFDSQGNLWVSRTGKGIVTQLILKDGVVVDKLDVFTDLRKPHGLAFDPDDQFVLYIAEEHRISRVRINSDGKLEKIADLPTSGSHFTRTIGFGPSSVKTSEGEPTQQLYVSVGSTCNACNEADWRRAKILVMNKDGSGMKEYAKGLRNSVFFEWRPDTDDLWATDMGRDLLGDNIPPDEVNIIREGQNYGWPICYGKNIHDGDFDKNTYIRNPCQEPFEQPSHIDLQAHSAPLGLAFIPSFAKASEGQAQAWPAEYQGDLLVAYHGSWNRTVPTGYKIVRFSLDGSGNATEEKDFVTGFFPVGGKGTSAALGRPVDLIFGPSFAKASEGKSDDSALYISDDKAGAIYRVRYTGGSTPVGSAGGCIVGGCSGEICYDKKDGDRASICIWKEEFACYKTARCERQLNGACGWTETEELRSCLNKGI